MTAGGRRDAGREEGAAPQPFGLGGEAADVQAVLDPYVFLTLLKNLVVVLGFAPVVVPL